MQENQLIPVVSRPVGTETIQTVNARDLHSFLEVGKHFGTWITDRISQFEFVENQDFIVFPEIGENPKGGRPAKEYDLSLDMAKELSMVERNAKGKQARQYFIECERAAKSVPAIDLSDPSFLRTALLTYTEKVIALEHQIVELAPKAGIADRLNGAEGNLSVRNASKALKMKEHKFVDWLRLNKWAFRNKKGKLEGYASHVPRYLDHKVVPIPVEGDPDRVSFQMVVTPAGLVKLAGIFNVDLYEQDLFQEAA